MSSIRRKSNQIGPGRIDPERAKGATEKQIATWKADEGYGDWEPSETVRAVPSVNVRVIREHIGLTQDEFASRYRLSLRTVQEWEQGRKQPSEAARVLLFAISREPKALERALRD